MRANVCVCRAAIQKMHERTWMNRRNIQVYKYINQKWSWREFCKRTGVLKLCHTTIHSSMLIKLLLANVLNCSRPGQTPLKRKGLQDTLPKGQSLTWTSPQLGSVRRSSSTISQRSPHWSNLLPSSEQWQLLIYFYDKLIQKDKQCYLGHESLRAIKYNLSHGRAVPAAMAKRAIGSKVWRSFPGSLRLSFHRSHSAWNCFQPNPGPIERTPKEYL